MAPEQDLLQQFFISLVHEHYSEGVGLHDPQLSEYVAGMLTDFCESEQLFKIRNAAGKPLDDIGEMLLESDPVYGPAPSFDRERGKASVERRKLAAAGRS